MQDLLLLDKKLFLLLNCKIRNDLFDLVMPILTNLKFWIPIIVSLVVYLIVKKGSNGRWVVFLVILAVTISDLSISKIWKPFFHRDRPNYKFSMVENGNFSLADAKGRYGMPSSHAANVFSAFTIFSLFFRNLRIYFFTIGIIIGGSRVYIGVHYPFDVIVGSLYGIFIGCLVFMSKEKIFCISRVFQSIASKEK